MTERKPFPIGVVTGDLSATLLAFTESITLCGKGTPSVSITSAPAVCISQSILTPEAFIIFKDNVKIHKKQKYNRNLPTKGTFTHVNVPFVTKILRLSYNFFKKI